MLFPTNLNEDVPTNVAVIFIWLPEIDKVSTENFLAMKALMVIWEMVFFPQTGLL